MVWWYKASKPIMAIVGVIRTSRVTLAFSSFTPQELSAMFCDEVV